MKPEVMNIHSIVEEDVERGKVSRNRINSRGGKCQLFGQHDTSC